MREERRGANFERRRTAQLRVVLVNRLYLKTILVQLQPTRAVGNRKIVPLVQSHGVTVGASRWRIGQQTRLPSLCRRVRSVVAVA